MNRDHKFTEAAVHAVSDRFRGMNIGDRTAIELLSVLRIVIGRAIRFDDHAAEPSMRPRRRAKGMVMPEHRPQIHVHPPAVANKLYGGNVMLGVIELQRLIKIDGVALDLLDTPDLRTTHIPLD